MIETITKKALRKLLIENWSLEKETINESLLLLQEIAKSPEQLSEKFFYRLEKEIKRIASDLIGREESAEINKAAVVNHANMLLD